MRYTLRSFALSSTLLLTLGSGLVLVAQETSGEPPAGAQGGHRHGPMTPEQEMTHLTKALNLTGDQQTQIKPILEDRQKQLEQLHGDTSLARPDKFAKMKSLDEGANTRVEAVLNPDQKAKYDQMIERRKEKMAERRAEHGHHGDQGDSEQNGTQGAQQ